MDESINTANKKQIRQKPPLNVVRIVGEILAGLVLGLVALLAVYGIGILVVDNGCFAELGFLAMFIVIFPPLNGLGNAVGVYYVGNRDNETGSFPVTFGFGFLGGFVAALLYFYGSAAGNVMLGIEKIVLWAFILLIPPILATVGFDLKLRYKKPPSP